MSFAQSVEKVRAARAALTEAENEHFKFNQHRALIAVRNAETAPKRIFDIYNHVFNELGRINAVFFKNWFDYEYESWVKRQRENGCNTEDWLLNPSEFMIIALDRLS